MQFPDFWLILFLHLLSCMARGCMENQIQCQNGEGCFDPKQRCDDVKDCENGFDEEECEPILLITTDRDIRSIPMNSEEYRFIQSDLTQAHGVSVDYKEMSLYWSEKGSHKSGIYKSMLDGSRNQNVISFGVEEVGDLKVDGLGRHLYYVDSGRKNIVVCDLQGTICIVLCAQLDKPRALAVYPEKSLLFWSDWGSHPHIASVGMDGSKRINIITTGVVWPSGLAVDKTTQRIFWGDTNLNRIESSRIDGSDRKILLNEVNPFCLAVFKNMIFWCDPTEHEIISADKNTGDHYKVIIRDDELTPKSIQMHHPSKQSFLNNPCQNANCSHLCLLSPSVQGFNCACPVRMTLNKNNRTCDSMTVDESSIIIATNSDIYRLNNIQIGKDSIIHLSKDLHLKNIGALVFNPLDNSIIYSDSVDGVIYSMDLNAHLEMVLFENADMVEGLDVDSFTGNIYWTERTRGTVMIARKYLNGVRERLVLARQLKNPGRIAIASELGLLFVVEGSKSQVITVWEMDGNWLNNLVQVNGVISAMAYDDNHLYFSDSLRGTIERIHVGGENRTILQEHLKTPIVMGLSSDSVFWLTGHSSRINWLNKQDPSVKHELIIPTSKNFEQFRLMTVVNHSKLNHNTSACPNNSNCHYKLGPSCLEEDFQCDSGHCIPMDSVCDEVSDCPDDTDEGDNCDTPCEDKLCDHYCFSGPKGPICYCEMGYRKNGHQCEDIDECSSENRCSQYCTNTEGDYDCSCAPGYTLEKDKYTCKVIDERPLMIVASAHRVAILQNSNVNSSYRGLASHDAPIKGIAYHGKLSTLFWITGAGVNRVRDVGQVLNYKMKGLIPSGLALDSITGNIYVNALIVGQDRSIIKVVSNSLDADVDIVNSQTKITDISIDGVRGALFWSEHSTSVNGRIIRSTMDGKFTREIYYTGIVYPVALSLDPIKSRIYWADKAQSISSCDYDGQHRKKLVVTRTNGQPLSLTFFENRISWTVLHQNAIYSQLVTGEPANNSFELFEGVQYLFTSHSILEPEYPNPCTTSSCGNGLCVLKNSSSFSCFCPTNTNLVSLAPFKCSSRCPEHSFYCHPDLECLPLNLVCSGNQDCENLSDLELCKRVNKTIISEDIFPTDSLTRRTLHSLFSFPLILSNASDRWITDAKKRDSHRISFPKSAGSKVLYSRHVEIRDEIYVNDGHVSGEDSPLPIETALQVVLDGPVYVLSRLFTKKGHHIDHATIFNQEKKPVFINSVWDIKNETTSRFVEDIEISNGNRLILWKVFRPQAYTADNNLNLRTVHQMELRTLEKMGFHLQVINLASWEKLTDTEKITFLEDAIALALKS